MRSVLYITMLCAPLTCAADPLLTITCEPVKGVARSYGPTLRERWESAGKPLPPPHLSEPRQVELPDYHATFVIDTSRKKLTRIWVESKENLKRLKEVGATPAPAREIQISSYRPDFILATQDEPLETTVYSFYPKLRMMFEMATSYDATGPTATQTTFFAKCEYAWSGKP